MFRITTSRRRRLAWAGLILLAWLLTLLAVGELPVVPKHHHAPPPRQTIKPLIHRVIYQNPALGNDLTCKGKLHSRPCASVTKACALARPSYIIYEVGQSPPRKSYRAACTVLPSPISANVFTSATGSDVGSNCKLFASAVTNPDTSGVTLCKSFDKAYKLARSGDTIEAECNGNFVGDDFVINYDSTKNLTQYVYIRPSTTCPNGVLGRPTFTLGQHTTATAQFTMLAGSNTNTIPVVSTAGFKIPGKVYVGWDTFGSCTGTQTSPTVAFTGCTVGGSTFSIIWDAGTDIKQGSLSILGPNYLDIHDVTADYNLSLDQTTPGGKNCPFVSATPRHSSHIVVDGIITTRFFSRADYLTIRNSQFGPDNSNNNAKIASYCQDAGTVTAPAPFNTATVNPLLDNVEFRDMSDAGCDRAATLAAFPAEGNQFCHNECLYLGDVTGLTMNAVWFNGCAIIDMFCSDDQGLGANFVIENSIYEPVRYGATSPNTVNCHTDHAGLVTSQKFINDDLQGPVIFQSSSGGKVDLVWANNIGSNPSCTNAMYNTLVFTNNVTFGGSPSCSVNNAASSAVAEWTNYPAFNYTLLSGATAVNHASATYAPATDKLGVSRCGAPDSGPLEKCP